MGSQCLNVESMVIVLFNSGVEERGYFVTKAIVLYAWSHVFTTADAQKYQCFCIM